jgi:hypothetical protein
MLKNFKKLNNSQRLTFAHRLARNQTSTGDFGFKNHHLCKAVLDFMQKQKTSPTKDSVVWLMQGAVNKWDTASYLSKKTFTEDRVNEDLGGGFYLVSEVNPKGMKEVFFREESRKVLLSHLKRQRAEQIYELLFMR